MKITYNKLWKLLIDKKNEKARLVQRNKNQRGNHGQTWQRRKCKY